MLFECPNQWNMFIKICYFFVSRGDVLNCTLWEDFATQFANYNNDRTEWGPTIILLHNAKINQATGDVYIYRIL
jgi:hypothetical protein